MKAFAGNNLSQELYKRAGNTVHTPRAKELREQLRAAVGVTPVLFGRWLSNASQPDLAQATMLAQQLDVTLDALVILVETEL